MPSMAPGFRCNTRPKGPKNLTDLIAVSAHCFVAKSNTHIRMTEPKMRIQSFSNCCFHKDKCSNFN